MFDRIEELQTKEQRLDTTIENLTELGELLPKDSVVFVDLQDGYNDISFFNGRIEHGLKEALDLPQDLRMNMEEASVVLFDDDGRKGLFLASRVPSKSCRVGLPGFLPGHNRFYYGAIWENGTYEIYSNLGNDIFEQESHDIKESDISALYMLCLVLSKVVLKTEKDDETGEIKKKLSNVRVNNQGI